MASNQWTLLIFTLQMTKLRWNHSPRFTQPDSARAEMGIHLAHSEPEVCVINHVADLLEHFSILLGRNLVQKVGFETLFFWWVVKIPVSGILVQYVVKQVRHPSGESVGGNGRPCDAHLLDTHSSCAASNIGHPPTTAQLCWAKTFLL